MKAHPAFVPFRLRLTVLAASLFALGTPAFAQISPQITSFGPNGELTCIHLEPGSTATVEWTSSLEPGDWDDWGSTLVDASGAIQVTVPITGMRGFYRVRGVPMPSIVVTATSLGVTEAGSGNFGVRLGFRPAATSTVTIGSSDTSAATASPPSLTFTPANWNTLQTVTVSGVADEDLAGESAIITLSSPGVSNRTVGVTVVDDDTQGLVTSPSSLTIGEAGSGTSGVRLAFQPTGNVTVNLSSSDPTAATVSPPTLTFTPANYAVPQTITVSGVGDIDLISESATITASASGANSGTVSVTVVDDDVQDILLSVPGIAIGESGSGTCSIRLAFQPTGNVVVNVTSSDPTAATASPTALVFTAVNYATPQTITVSGVNDSDLLDESLTVSLASTGLTTRSLSVEVNDDD
jgi:hypothetical protein